MLEKLPKSFIIRGGGATGVEWASVYHRYGIPTTLVGNVVPQEDEEVQQAMERALRRQKMDVVIGARPTANDIDITKEGVTMRLKDAKGKEKTVEAEALMVGIGREPVIEDIGLEELGIKKDEGGFIIADSMLRTNVEGIYAIGDVNGQQMLAHTAMHHGIIAVEHIMGLNPFPLDVLNSPSCTYCRAGDRLGRVDREAGAGQGHQCQDRQVPDEAECQGDDRGAYRWLHQDRGRCRHERPARAPYHRPARDRDDRRGRARAAARKHAVRAGNLGPPTSDRIRGHR